MDVLRAGERLKQRLKTVDGLEFFGEVESRGDVFDDVTLAEYSLRVGVNSVAVPGKALNYVNSRFLIAAGITEAFNAPGSVYLRLIRVTHELTWSRPWTDIDPVTQLSKTVAPHQFGPALCALRFVGPVVDVFKVPGSRFKLITNSAVEPGDNLGEYVVTFSTPHLGVYFTEVR